MGYFSTSKMGTSANSLSVLIICFTILVLTQKSLAYFVTVDAHAEECFLDIDVRIEGPDGRTVHSGERESNGKYTFAAHQEGVYKYCFSNQMSTMTPKIVMFNMDIGDAPEETADGEEPSHN